VNAVSVSPTPLDVALGLRIDAAIAGGARLPRWGWGVPGPYNGATGPERVVGWQRVHLAERFGWLIRAAECSICRSTQRLHLHTENYFREMCVRSICQKCHFCLHRRFRDPAQWRGLIVDAPASAAWARSISLTELTRDAAMCLARQHDPWLRP